jgi:hypothetical protein
MGPQNSSSTFCPRMRSPQRRRVRRERHSRGQAAPHKTTEHRYPRRSRRTANQGPGNSTAPSAIDSRLRKSFLAQAKNTLDRGPAETMPRRSYHESHEGFGLPSAEPSSAQRRREARDLTTRCRSTAPCCASPVPGVGSPIPSARCRGM